MTATASKTGLRAAAKARTAKAAQRTPLPSELELPKGVTPEMMTVVEKIAKLQAMTLPQLRAYAREWAPALAGISKKADLQAALIKDVHARNPLPTPKKATRAKKTAEPKPELKEYEPKGKAKAVKLRDELIPHGWAGEMLAPTTETVELILRRGSLESLHISWINGVFQYESASHQVADRVVKIRNVSQARQLAVRPPSAASEDLARVASNKAFKRAEAPKVRRVQLPFDPNLATDAEVSAAILGRKVKWINRLTNHEEEAWITRDAKRLRIEEQAGSRVILFCCPVAGFRAFRVEALTSVSKHHVPAPAPRPERNTKPANRKK